MQFGIINCGLYIPVTYLFCIYLYGHVFGHSSLFADGSPNINLCPHNNWVLSPQRGGNRGRIRLNACSASHNPQVFQMGLDPGCPGLTAHFFDHHACWLNAPDCSSPCSGLTVCQLWGPLGMVFSCVENVFFGVFYLHSFFKKNFILYWSIVD